jgi:integrase
MQEEAVASLRASREASASTWAHRRAAVRQLPGHRLRGNDPLTKKPRYIRETLKTYGAAEVALTRLQGQVDQNRHPKTDIMLRQAINRWLDIAKLEHTTRDRYEDLVRMYVGPVLGDFPAGKLDAELLESFYARLQRCRDLCDGRRRARHQCRPLSGSTVRKIHYVISAALEQAVRWHHLGVNPAALAIAPSANHTEPDPPSAEEAAAIIAAAWGDPDWGLLLWVMMVSGMRRGEISALRWRNVDFATDILIVQRANAQPRSGVKEKQTTTRQQRRIAIDPQTAALLRAALGAALPLAGRRLPRRHVRLLSGAGRIITVRATLSEPPLSPAGDEARSAQYTAAFAAPLCGDRTHRRWRRRMYGYRAPRSREWGRDDAQGVRGMGRRSRPPSSDNDGRDHRLEVPLPRHPVADPTGKGSARSAMRWKPP